MRKQHWKVVLRAAMGKFSRVPMESRLFVAEAGRNTRIIFPRGGRPISFRFDIGN